MDITEKTKVPLFATLVCLASVIPAAMWMSSLSVRASETDTRVDRVVDKIHRMEAISESHHEETLKLLTDVRERVIRIEQQVKDHN